MVCPHCSRQLMRKERVGRTCQYCGRRFVFDPQLNAIRLHDARLRRIAGRLRRDGVRHYTVAQLWYAAVGAHLRTRPWPGHMDQLPRSTAWTEPSPDPDKEAREARAAYKARMGEKFAWVAGISFVFTASTGFEGRVVVAVMPFVAVAVILILVSASRGRARAGRIARQDAINLPRRASSDREAAARTFAVPVVAPHVTDSTGLEWFRGKVTTEWKSAHGSLLPGLRDETREVVRPVEGEPRMALLCADHAVLIFLASHGVVSRHGMALVPAAEEVPPDVPVLVLHEASAAGVAMAARVKDALGERAVILGLRPRSVMARKNAVRARRARLAPEEEAATRADAAALGLTAEETDWLVQGWASAVAAVPPAKLLSVVNRAAERTAADGLGFLTWPG